MPGHPMTFRMGKKSKICGGTHAVLWRERSVAKLRRVFLEDQDGVVGNYQGIDCRLNTRNVVSSNETFGSYCVQANVARIKHTLGSDIPHCRERAHTTALCEKSKNSRWVG